MIRQLSQLLLVSIFIISCSDNDSNKTDTEIISDSYYFQKKLFNVNLYNCLNKNERFSADYLITTDSFTQIRLSEILENKEQIPDCDLESFELNELTPNYSSLLNNSFFLELSNCTALNEGNVETYLEPYLSMLKREEINVWSGVSNLDEDNFFWINIWESEQSRTDFMEYWVKTRKSGLLANDLRDIAYCESPNTYMFLK